MDEYKTRIMDNEIREILEKVKGGEMQVYEAQCKICVLYNVSNRFVVAKFVNGNYVHLETSWSNDYLKKKGYEVVDFFNNRKSAVEECNRLNGC